MWNRLLDLLKGNSAARVPAGPVRRWAMSHGLVFRAEPGVGFTMGGPWHQRPVRVEYGLATRPYIEGNELSGRLDLGLDPAPGVVLMNRELRRQFEQQRRAWRDVDSAHTHQALGPWADEIHTLLAYREVGWDGPSTEFWGRYAVLSDAPDLARQWLEPEIVDRLMHWPLGGVMPHTPVMYMLLRGKVYMRVQMDVAPDPDTALHALDLFRRLSQQAMALGLVRV